MALPHHHRIARMLELVKGQGIISEYFVSWRGRGGRLEPRVAVWRRAGAVADKVHGKVMRLLSGLVPGERIVVVDDDAARPVATIKAHSAPAFDAAARGRQN